MRHNRKSIRLKNYDYSQAGMYFVTFCAKDRECIFGEIVETEMYLNECGKIVNESWARLPSHYGHIHLDSFVVMPNHIHGIIQIVGAGFKPAPTVHGLSEIIRALKTFSAREINKYRKTPGKAVWQRGFYEHIIRDEKELFEKRKYIEENPLKWSLDPDYRDF